MYVNCIFFRYTYSFLLIKAVGVKKYEDLSIFIVDDDPMCRELYKQYMRNMGFTKIELFDSGRQCIGELVKKPDIILLDHNMTPMNGIDTLEKIKRFNPDIYVIYVSAQDDIKVAVNAFRYGAFDYVMKSDMKEGLLAIIIREIISVMEMLNRNFPGRPRNFAPSSPYKAESGM